MTTFFRYIHITKIITLKIIVLLFFLGIQVKVSAQPVIVVSPNGGENWEANSAQTIKWESTGISKVKIEYSLDNGLSWGIIAESIDASLGEYPWTTPDVKTPYVMIRVGDASNPFINDISNENFTIVIKEKNKQLNKSAQASGATIKIMPLGDSITWGTNPSGTNSPGYRRQLNSLLTNAGYNFDFVGSLVSGLPDDFDRDNEGHPGWVAGNPAYDQEARLDTELTGFLNSNLPDVILLLIGTNDITEQDNIFEKTAAEVAVALRKLLDSIYVFNPNITIFLANIIDRADNQYRHDKTVQTNSLLPATINALPTAQKQRIVLLDMYNELGDYHTNHANPNFTYQVGSNLHTLHPNNNGYQVMADTWFNALQSRYRPLLTGPDNNSVNQDINVTLDWDAPPAAFVMNVVYNLQVAADTSFSDIVLDSTNISSTSLAASGLKYGTKYYWRVRIPGYGWSTVWNFTTESMLVSIKIFLQGPYAGNGTMNTTLNSKGLIPASHPYNTSPWNYSGSENVVTIPSGVVDWVLVELKINDTTITKTRAAFLKSDGTIVDLNGTGPLSLNDILPGNYYVVIRHRNHLSVMSAVPVSLINNALTYDFTTDSSKFYGGSFGAKELEAGTPSIWGMAASDGNSDGFINAVDLNLTWRPENGFDEYLKGDYNLDGYVNAVDKNLFWRSNNGTDSKVE